MTLYEREVKTWAMGICLCYTWKATSLQIYIAASDYKSPLKPRKSKEQQTLTQSERKYLEPFPTQRSASSSSPL